MTGMKGKWYVVDHGDGTYTCSGCGARLWPDCDISSNSVAEEFTRHMWERHQLIALHSELVAVHRLTVLEHDLNSDCDCDLCREVARIRDSYRE